MEGSPPVLIRNTGGLQGGNRDYSTPGARDRQLLCYCVRGGGGGSKRLREQGWKV
jgi:hypothetical protein